MDNISRLIGKKTIMKTTIDEKVGTVIPTYDWKSNREIFIFIYRCGSSIMSAQIDERCKTLCFSKDARFEEDWPYAEGMFDGFPNARYYIYNEKLKAVGV